MFEEVCHPTHCPRCGAEPIYFIRHNGGSVWVDALGWPWPKHACFDDDSDRTSYSGVESLAGLIGGLAQGSLGLVNRLSRMQSPVGPRIQIGCLDGTLIAARGQPGYPYEQLLGELVVLSRERRLLIHKRLGEFPIQILPDAEIEDGPGLVWHRDTELMTKCALCGGYYYEDEKEIHTRRCPRKLRPVRSRKPDNAGFSLQLEPPAAWSKCPKCACSVAEENLQDHVQACRGPTPKPAFKPTNAARKKRRPRTGN